MLKAAAANGSAASRAACQGISTTDALEDGACPPQVRSYSWTLRPPKRERQKVDPDGSVERDLVHRGVVAALIRELRAREPEAESSCSPHIRRRSAVYDSEANTNRVPRILVRYGSHQQGTESDSVIIDLVLAPGRGKSRFMTSESRLHSQSLNVADVQGKRRLVWSAL